jgi:hypothetical protein
MQDAQIFVSYRRDDTRGWLRQIRRPLECVFGAERIFVDTRSIEPGALFPVELQWALERAAVVLALIGPHWADAEGRARLAEPDDWVRHELLAALERKVRIVPVLLGKAALPAQSDLPAELRPLLERQAVALSEEHWDADLDRLIERLAGSVERDNVCDVTMDLRRLLHLVHLHAETARAVGESAGALRDICLLTTKLAARKRIHDLLHEIEEECLQPLAAAPDSRRVAGHAKRLAEAAAAIEAELPASGVPFARAQRLRSGLARAGDSLRDLVAAAQPAMPSPPQAPGKPQETQQSQQSRQSQQPQQPQASQQPQEPQGPQGPQASQTEQAQHARWRRTMRAAQAALAEVLSSLSPMNEFIADAAGQLRLADLAAVLTEVRQTLDPAAHPLDRAHLADNAAKLGGLAAELRWRVAEHGLLQAVDDQLRAAVQHGSHRGPTGFAAWPEGHAEGGEGGSGPAELAQLRRLLDELEHGDFDPMPTLREAMHAGHCLHLRRVAEQLRELLEPPGVAAAPASPASAIDSEAGAPRHPHWPQRLHEQHAKAAHQFNDADVELMSLCARLGDLGDSLAHLLDSVGDPR